MVITPYDMNLSGGSPEKLNLCAHPISYGVTPEIAPNPFT
jgi:hypothetical protein